MFYLLILQSVRKKGERRNKATSKLSTYFLTISIFMNINRKKLEE